MKKLILAAVAVSLAGAFVPDVSAAAVVHKTVIRTPHCKIVKKRIRRHGHVRVVTKKMCW